MRIGYTTGMEAPPTLLVPSDSTFPPLLREIADPPKQLYLRGVLPAAPMKYLAVVGSRRYTPYGRQACEQLIRGLRGQPIAIVSGLALGIDGIAHEAALASGLTTVAVPGSGLDDRVLYPASHRDLAKRILAAGGALLSEFEPLSKPRPESFPQRNRIMAGLAHAVLVVEAEVKSGTLITARLAAEYNRDVLAVPGPIGSPTSTGPHLLLKKGAALIAESADILEALGLRGEAPQHTLPLDLSHDECAIIELLRTPQTRDDLIAQSGLPATTANIILTSLELKGLIAERMGKVVRV